jgi:hypothetical protein
VTESIAVLIKSLACIPSKHDALGFCDAAIALPFISQLGPPNCCWRPVFLLLRRFEYARHRLRGGDGRRTMKKSPRYRRVLYSNNST